MLKGLVRDHFIVMNLSKKDYMKYKRWVNGNTNTHEKGRGTKE